MCNLENGFELSQVPATISFPVGAVTVSFQAHILKDVVVSLPFCIDELNRCELYFNNISNQLIHVYAKQIIPVTGIYNHQKCSKT